MVGGMLYDFLALFFLCVDAVPQNVRHIPVALQVGNTSQRLRGSATTMANACNTSNRNQVSVAVVGSGPISDADRVLIRGAQEIYRFNSMNNLRLGETVGTVFLRRGGFKADVISGLPPSSASCPFIKLADALLIIMDRGPGLSPQRLQDLRANWPRVEVVEESPHGMLEIDGDRVFPNPAGWSSGFIGVAHVLNHSSLVKQGHKVHIFGMNWKDTSVHSGGHPWMKEKEALANAKSVVVHPTATFNYKPRSSLGRMLWTCEGAFSFHSRSESSHVHVANEAERAMHRSFGLESNDDGSFAFVVSNASSREYIVADGSLSIDKAKGMIVDVADIEASNDTFELTLGEDTYEIIRETI